MQLDWLTFGLALVAYALLAEDVVRRVRGARSAALSSLAAAVVIAHVVCVWAYRFDWSFAEMWRKSVPGFLIFHGALIAILTARVAPEPLQTRLLYLAFGIVSAGALPAPFRYEEIALLTVPMIATFAAALVRIVRHRSAGSKVGPNL